MVEIGDAAVNQLAERFLTVERRQRFAEIAAQRLHLRLFCERPGNERNVAACARSLEAFGGSGIHVSRNERLDSLECRRAARGGSRWLEVVWHETTAAAISQLKGDGYQLVGTSVSAEAVPLADWQPGERVVVCMGPEYSGISEELRDACGQLVHVPMHGFTQSLNLAVSAAILLQDASEKMRRGGRGALLPCEQDRLLLDWRREDLQRAFGEQLPVVAKRHAEIVGAGTDNASG